MQVPIYGGSFWFGSQFKHDLGKLDDGSKPKDGADPRKEVSVK